MGCESKEFAGWSSLHGAAIKSQKLHEKKTIKGMKNTKRTKGNSKKIKYLKSRLLFHAENMEPDSNKRQNH